MAHPPRRFPSPWRADPMPGGKVVRDANGKALASIYSRENEDEGRQAKVLTGDEARRGQYCPTTRAARKGGSRLIRSSGFVRTNVMLVAEPSAGRADALRIKGSEQGPRRAIISKTLHHSAGAVPPNRAARQRRAL
jgi:hypothetical protein